MSKFKDFLILSEVSQAVNELTLICEHQYVEDAKSLLKSLYAEYKNKEKGDSYHDEVESIIKEINGLMQHLPKFIELCLKDTFTHLTSEILGFEKEDIPDRILSQVVFSHYAKLVIFEYVVANLVNNSVDPKFKVKLEEFAHSLYNILCAADNQKNDSIFKGFSYYRNSILKAKSTITALYRFIQVIKHE